MPLANWTGLSDFRNLLDPQTTQRARPERADFAGRDLRGDEDLEGLVLLFLCDRALGVDERTAVDEALDGLDSFICMRPVGAIRSWCLVEELCIQNRLNSVIGREIILVEALPVSPVPFPLGV